MTQTKETICRYIREQLDHLQLEFPKALYFYKSNPEEKNDIGEFMKILTLIRNKVLKIESELKKGFESKGFESKEDFKEDLNLLKRLIDKYYITIKKVPLVNLKTGEGIHERKTVEFQNWRTALVNSYFNQLTNLIGMLKK